MSGRYIDKFLRHQDKSLPDLVLMRGIVRCCQRDALLTTLSLPYMQIGCQLAD